MLYLSHIILLQVASSLFSPSASTQEVLAFMKEIPACEDQSRKVCRRPGGWDRIGAAQEIAKAISSSARSREEAARMAVFAAFEGGNQKLARGDGGKSRGVFQLQGVPDYVAFTPELAARAWLRLADSVACLENPSEERLAALASGSCQRGRALVRGREAIVQKLLAGSAAVAVE